MGIPLRPYFLICLLQILCFTVVSVRSQCLEDQQSLLLQLKSSLKLTFSPFSTSSKLVQWNESTKTECCHWAGVTCDTTGHVIGLDLNDESITGGLDSSSSLFQLKYLQSLNLFGNDFNYSRIPSGFSRLTSLTYLNLSYCDFAGQIPVELTSLTSLVTLDLSSWANPEQDSLTLENPNLSTLLRNLTRLTALYLDGVNISANAYDWCQVISSSLPNLKELSLRNCLLSGPLDSSLQKLQSLSVFQLSQNNLSAPIPDFFADFKNLTVLELYYSNLTGEFPEKVLNFPNLAILDLYNNSLSGPMPLFPMSKNLVSIDLSFNAFNGSIPSSLFALSSLQNFQLSNNHFDGPLTKFSNASSSQLVALDLSSNHLEGPIPPSFFKLKRLSFLSLAFNNLNGTVELQSMGEMGSLLTLDLSYNNLSIEVGNNNSNSLLLPNITTLKLASCNLESFPNLKNLTSLSFLDLSANRIGGELPNWIWENVNIHLNLSHNSLVNLQEPYDLPASLGILDLHANQLSGEIPLPPPSALYVDYSANRFNSSLPIDIGYNLNDTSFFSVSNNMLSGTIPDSICQATRLEVLDLSYNTFSSRIPSCLIEMNLIILYLGNNSLSGYIPEILNIPEIFPRDCKLKTLDLHGNLLEGEIPKSLAMCSMLEVLNLGKNLLNDTFPCFLKGCTNLQVLSLRSNMLHGDILCIEAARVWPKLQIIDLASNYFTGHVASSFFNWRAMKGDQLKVQVVQPNSSYYMDRVAVMNKGSEMELVKILTIFTAIDISNNKFSGEIPGSIGDLTALYVLNMAHNAFTGSIPTSIGKLRQLESLDLSVNNLAGTIPDSICQATSLQVLDLSYNRLSSRIPSCLIEMIYLDVLNLGNNNLSGNIPEIFPRVCKLETLDLHGNLLEGEVPKSLVRCSMLEVLNLGKNRINDTFPCFLKGCTNLQVLSLRSNMLHGDILCIEAARVWPKLQIIDLASNYFTGHVARSFFNWRAMKGDHLKVQVLQPNSYYYVDTVTVMNKGLEMELVKILTIFTAIDISNNRFTGEIPQSIGDLSALYVLNMSHYAFTSSIPTSIGKLRQLGSLDLSVNSLAGTIPTELTSLTFLEYLNLSCNRLEGKIPTGGQFLTFTETSFVGNKGLCGSQLNISCTPDEPAPPSEEADLKGESIVDVVGVEVGFVVGLATFIAPLMFSRRWSRWYYKHAERILVTKVYWYYERRNRERRLPIRRLE